MQKMNKNKIIKFLWWSMWATLLLMVVLKLTFNYYYPIVIENSKIISIGIYIDNHKMLYYPLAFINYIANTILITLCCLKEKWYNKKLHLILILIFAVIAFPFKYINTLISFILILIPYIVIPLFITKNHKKWIFITFILDNIFQILSNFTRGNPAIIIDSGYLIKQFMMIDYYLLFIIYYIGGNYMGDFTLLPWFTKKVTVIDAKIEKLQKKIKKLEDKKQCLKKR